MSWKLKNLRKREYDLLVPEYIQDANEIGLDISKIILERFSGIKTTFADGNAQKGISIDCAKAIAEAYECKN